MTAPVNRFSLLRISSEDKSQPDNTNSDFVVNINPSGGNITQVAKVSLKYATCPNVFYNVPSGLNVLVFEDAGDPGVLQTVTLTPGQYTVQQLITALQTAMNASISTGTVTITLNPTTQKLTFTSSVENITIYLTDTTMSDIIGLGANTASALTVTMDNPVNLSGEAEVFIHSRIVAISRLYEGSGNFSVIGVIPLNVAFGQNAYYVAPDEELDTIDYQPKQSARTLQQVDVKLRSRDGRLLSLPDNFYFSMILQIYYK